jgi:glycosyltransferase involved in cell wall biosynthesis
MLNLAEFKGLASKKFASIPCIAYFHENQLAYPTNYDKKKDRYFGWINITTALAADSVWFNSEYHKNVFIHEVKLKIKKAPDQRPKEIIDKILQKSHIVPQGVKQFPTRTHKINGPLKILWAARWEFDKNPEGFFDAVRIAKNNGADFRISVLGGGNAKISSEVFAEAEKEFAEIIDNWGFLESQEDYEKVLMNSDIVVSTAHHEFFGISVAEAVSAGCFPIVPHELAYPEVLQENSNDIEKISFFFDGSSKHLAEKIIKLSKIHKSGNSIWEGDNQRGINKISRFYWTHINKTIDNLIHNLI